MLFMFEPQTFMFMLGYGLLQENDQMVHHLDSSSNNSH